MTSTAGEAALPSLFDRSDDLTLTHPTGSYDAERLRQALQLRQQHRREASTCFPPCVLGDPATRPGAYRAVLR